MAALVSAAEPARSIARARNSSPQVYARLAGVLLLISVVAGGFGEFFVPTTVIVAGDAAATAHNIVANASLYRMGFAGYLVEAMCDLSLTLVFYVLLRPVHKDLALLAVFIRLVGTAVFAAGELFYLAPLLILGGADHLKSFSPDQLNGLAYLSLNIYGYGADRLANVLYGAGSIVLGYLMFRSGFLPRILGLLMTLGGLGFAIRGFLLVLAPAYASFAFMLPAALAGLALILWLLARGVDVPRWEERAALTR
jgi:uncharacterized protein DUF4386